MKKLLALFVLASNVAFAQVGNENTLPQKIEVSPFNSPKKYSTDLFEGSPSLLQSAPLFKNKGFQNPGNGKILKLISPQNNNGSIRIMQPDNMPCLIPDMSKVEKMPVTKFENIPLKDPMPNAMKKTAPVTDQK
jgi:hypothetical protein